MSKELKAFDNLCGHLDYDTTDYMFNGGYEEDSNIIEIALKELEEYKSILKDFGLENPQNLIDNLNIIKDCGFHKKLEVLDLLFRKGVNIVLLDYLYHINPDNAFETYNKEMHQNWCDLYELNRDQFNMIVDYIEERKRK